MLDIWAEEDLKVGTLSNSTVDNYLHAIRKIKEHPIGIRKLKTVTAEHLQQYMDLLTFGGTAPDGKVYRGFSKDYVRSFSAVLNNSFKFAVLYPPLNKRTALLIQILSFQTHHQSLHFCMY